MKIKFYSHSFIRMTSAGMVFLFLAVSFLAGCRLSIRSINQNTKTELTVRIIYPQSSSLALQHRSAVPVLPQEQIFWKVEARNISDLLIATEETRIQSSSSDSSTSFILGITPGRWEITVLGYKNESDAEEGLEEKAIFQGEKEVSVNENGYYETSIQVYYIQSGNGNINLAIDVSTTNLEKMTVYGTDTCIDGVYLRNENGFFVIEKDNVPAATYSPVFTFYEFQTDFVQVLSLQEKINVRQNMTTDKWIKSGNTIYLNPAQDDYADFVLTPETIMQLINTSFYVASRNAEERKLPQIVAQPSDSNSGYWTAPFETIQAAIKKIQVLNKTAVENNLSNDTNYTIYIDGPVHEQECSFLEMSGFPCIITIKPYKNMLGETTAIIYGQNAATNNSSNSNTSGSSTNTSPSLPSVFTIDKENTLILSDIEIEAGNINVENDGNLILQGEPKLRNGLIILEENAILLLDDINSPNNSTGSSSSQNPIIANIKSTAPVKDKVLLKGYENQIISENLLSRFHLKNPGYYLDYDESLHQGFINASSVTIQLPKIDVCTVHINAANSQNNITKTNNNTFIITQDFSALPQITAAETIFSASVETPEVAGDNEKIYLDNSKIALTLYVDGIPFIHGSNKTENNREKCLMLPEDFIFKGNYILEVSYEYDGIFYDEKTLVTVL